MDARIRMKAWRLALGLSKQDFARKLEVWPSQVTMWESDKYKLNPTHLTIDKLCAYAKITPARFYGSLPRRKRNRRTAA